MRKRKLEFPGVALLVSISRFGESLHTGLIFSLAGLVVRMGFGLNIDSFHRVCLDSGGV